jgi:SAM-dependent methyltransferase
MQNRNEASTSSDSVRSGRSVPLGRRRLPDPIFADPRLARIYDPLDADRSDLALYTAIVDEVRAGSVLDIGCGTGTFACLLADRGIEVIGVDPAGASLAVARTKPGAERVRWIHGDATTLPPLTADLATMTGNVAQVFLHDDELVSALRGIRGAIRSGGTVAFEVRDPDRQAWRSWTREQSERRTDVPGVGVVESWVELLEVSLPFVSFRWTYRFEEGGEVVTSESTLRFRRRSEIERAVMQSGLVVLDIRDAPDRPRLELVFVCGRPAGG